MSDNLSRLKIISISDRFAFDLIKFHVADESLSGSHFVSANYNYESRCFDLTITKPERPIVPELALIPRVNIFSSFRRAS